MKITKTTNKYMFFQEGNDYRLNLGEIRKGEDTTTELLFEGFDSANTELSPKCGCTLVGKNIIDANSLSVKLKYTQCDTSFTKVVVVNENQPNSLKIRISGLCR